MAKKRTGLQSEMAGIFSGVPVPKKGGKRSQSDSPAPKPDSPASKPDDFVLPKPVETQPQIPVEPTPKKVEEPLPAVPKPKVIEIKSPEQIVKKIPKKKTSRRKDKIFAPKSGVSSSRQKAEIILFLFFSAILVIVLLRVYNKFSRDETSQDTLPGVPGTTTVANIEINWTVPSEYKKIRDPMDPCTPIQKDDDSGNPVVRGISYSVDRRYAVIGTKTVAEGDFVPGTKIRVKKINPNSVEFEEDGRTRTQEVEGEKR